MNSRRITTTALAALALSLSATPAMAQTIGTVPGQPSSGIVYGGPSTLPRPSYNPHHRWTERRMDWRTLTQHYYR